MAIEWDEKNFIGSISAGWSKHAERLGDVVIGWNSLQLAFGNLFSTVMTKGNEKIGWAIWNSGTSDRAQRQMLFAAASVLECEASLKADLKWVLGQIEELEENRNNFVHAPYEMVIKKGRLVMQSAHGTGHRRAGKLATADLEQKLTRARERLSELTHYVGDLQKHWLWPEDAPRPTRV